MIFASHIFLFWFLPLVLVVYFALPKRGRSLFLALASYLFYGWWRVDFLVPLLVSTVVDYFCGGRISRRHALPGTRSRQRAYLWLSMVFNLGLLAYFKYMNFGIESFNQVLQGLGMESVSWTNVALPVGISFYTFQSMSYTIDLYRGHAKPVDSFLDFMCYVALFPQLVCGPIVRYQHIAEQLSNRSHTLEKFSRGVLLFQLGLMKKLLVADSVATVADAAFAQAGLSVLESWLGILAYTFQIYFDFSGYSDMAIGLGMMFGFVFPLNFNSPYKSTSITDFWRRWHISLSSWLRDYLYIPLGGNRRGRGRTYLNLVTTFLLCGLWHGAAWNFLVWGAYHGCWLILERLNRGRGLWCGLSQPLQVAATFVVAMGGWVFFRADSCGHAASYLGTMVGIGSTGWWSIEHFVVGRFEFLALLIGAAAAFLLPNSQELVKRPSAMVAYLAPAGFLVAVTHLFFQSYKPFLYFQF